jgi:glycosyltransferase involved in cell wall biosynthesis
VLSQTEVDIELIVVDDASSDGTSLYLADLQSKDDRVRLLRNPTPTGGAAARNRGIESSRGQWIAFLDDDDEWLPWKIAAQLAVIAKTRQVVACSSWYLLRRPYRRDKLVRLPSKIDLGTLLKGNIAGGASLCLVRADVARQAGGFDATFRSAQDWEFWTRIAQLGDIAVCMTPTVVYQNHQSTRISNDSRAVYQGTRSYYFKFRPLMSPATRRTQLAHSCFVLSRQHHRSLRRRIAYLSLAISNAERETAHRYLLSSGIRIAVDAIVAFPRDILTRVR